MRETCTSGSVRGEGGNILTYSALSDSETHQCFPAARPTVGFAALNPPYRHRDHPLMREICAPQAESLSSRRSKPRSR
jgi:hypothetical protein